MYIYISSIYTLYISVAMKKFKIIPRVQLDTDTDQKYDKSDKMYEYLMYIGFEDHTLMGNNTNNSSTPTSTNSNTTVIQIADSVVERHLQLSADQFQYLTDHPPDTSINTTNTTDTPNTTTNTTNTTTTNTTTSSKATKKNELRLHKIAFKNTQCMKFTDFIGIFEIKHNPALFTSNTSNINAINAISGANGINGVNGSDNNTTMNTTISNTTIPVMLLTQRLDDYNNTTVTAINTTTPNTNTNSNTNSNTVQVLCASLLVHLNANYFEHTCSLAY